jgi:hypothetical protein
MAQRIFGSRAVSAAQALSPESSGHPFIGRLDYERLPRRTKPWAGAEPPLLGRYGNSRTSSRGRCDHPAASPSNAIMWLVLSRAPLPDARHWPGRRSLALVDAVAWPGAWIALAMHLPQPMGIVGPMIVALAVFSAIARARRAAWQNHRYHFTTWRWGRVAAALLLIGLVLKMVMQSG